MFCLQMTINAVLVSLIVAYASLSNMGILQISECENYHVHVNVCELKIIILMFITSWA